MYLSLVPVLFVLPAFHCILGKDVRNGNHCDLLQQWLESTSLSMEISKQGFHREVITTVKFSTVAVGSIRVLLMYRWPRGVFIDPYQIATLRDQTDWQILLDSAIDLEVPAHKTSGFVTYVYPNPNEPSPKIIKVTIPIHGRYHEPSSVGKMFTSVGIQPPELLLQNDKCLKLNIVEPHNVVDAPCTADNSSTCPWVKIQPQQKHGSLTIELPVGDGSLMIPVCSGTLLITMICCVLLSKYMWRHQIIH